MKNKTLGDTLTYNEMTDLHIDFVNRDIAINEGVEAIKDEILNLKKRIVFLENVNKKLTEEAE